MVSFYHIISESCNLLVIRGFDFQNYQPAAYKITCCIYP